jgi:hypothetical protein
VDSWRLDARGTCAWCSTQARALLGLFNNLSQAIGWRATYWCFSLIAFPYFLTACGGGFDRIIRKIWEYIPTQPIYKLKKTLFILEMPNAYNRLDIYSNKLNTHLICNVSHDKNYNDFNIFVTENYLVPPTLSDTYFTQITNSITNWYIDCVNPIQQIKNSKNSLSGLISFFKLNNIPFLLSGQLDFVDYGLFPNIEKNILYVNIDEKEYDSILRYSNDTNKKISNDIKNSTDDHPGLFAHREWADGIINFINTTEL